MGENKTQVAAIKQKFSRMINVKKQFKLGNAEEELHKSQEKCAIGKFKKDESDIKAWILVSDESQVKKHAKKFFVAEVQSKSSEGFRVKFACETNNDKYKMPVVDNIADIDEYQVKKVLPEPKMFF